jgi:hypothetical protein
MIKETPFEAITLSVQVTKTDLDFVELQRV